VFVLGLGKKEEEGGGDIALRSRRGRRRGEGGEVGRGGGKKGRMRRGGGGRGEEGRGISL
jgi:hypothetical protein